MPISWKQELILLNSETLINMLYIGVQYKMNYRLWSIKFLFGGEIFIKGDWWYFSGNILAIFSKGRGLSVVPNTAGGAKGRLLTVVTGLSKPSVASCLHWGDKGTSEALRAYQRSPQLEFLVPYLTSPVFLGILSLACSILNSWSSLRISSCSLP